MITPADVTRVQDLIRNPSHWTQFALARDRYGEEVWPNDPTACRFCASGAAQYLNLPELNWLLDEAAEELFEEPSIIRVNDHHGYAAVMTCFEHVKERLSS